MGSVALEKQHFKAKQEIKAKGTSKLLFVQVQLVFGSIFEAAGKPKEGQNLQSHFTFEGRMEGVPLCRLETRLD